MTKTFAAALTGMLALGCAGTSLPGTGTTEPTETIQVQAGQDFNLAVGQAARVAGTPITVLFRSVAQDSRCPSDVQCVWAGDAGINLGLQSTAAASQVSTLHTSLDPRMVTYSGYRIRVVGLAPIPRSGSPIPAEKYVVTLEVSRP